MAASALLTLDTQPPQVVIGEPEWLDPLVGDSNLRVPYTVDELADLIATSVAVGFGEVPVVIDPDYFYLEAPTEVDLLHLTVEATDDVDNTTVIFWSFDFIGGLIGFADVEYPLGLIVDSGMEPDLILDATDTDMIIESTNAELTIDPVLDVNLLVDAIDDDLTIDPVQAELNVDPLESDLVIDDVDADLIVDEYHPPE